jgi:hypothetical protein
MSQTNETNIINIFSNLLNSSENNYVDKSSEIITKLHEHVKSKKDIDTLLLLSNTHSSYLKNHIISEVIVNWCIYTREKLQIYFIKTLYDLIDFQSLNIYFNIILMTLQKLLANRMIKDEIIIQSLQEIENKDLCLIIFTMNQRKLSLNTVGAYSNCTLLEIVAKELKEDIQQRLLKLFLYLLQHTDVHVNVYNIYAVLADLYEHNTLNSNHHFKFNVNNFFINNKQDISLWIKSKKFYDKLYQYPFTTIDELKNILIEFVKYEIIDISTFLLMPDKLNQNVLSYCHTLTTLENTMKCDWIPNVLKQEYKIGCFYKINNHYCEKIKPSFYMNGNLQTCLDKLFYTNFFLIDIPIKYSDQLKERQIPIENFKTFILIANKKFPIDLCKIIYDKIILC